MTPATIYDERIKAIIALLQRERDKQLEESDKYPFDPRGYEAAGFAFGMSYAIGALNACIRKSQPTIHRQHDAAQDDVRPDTRRARARRDDG